MFRITKIFENGSFDIYKIEGKITDESLQVWTKELETLQKQADRKLILDFSQVWSINAKAIEILIAHSTNATQIMNPGIEVRNMLYSAGLSARVLE